MEAVADTHLHLYPCYDLDRAFSLLLDRLAARQPQAVFAACLTERHDCHFYEQLRTGEQVLHDFTVEQSDRRQLVLCRTSDGKRLALLPGRQVIAAERIEVLALCTDQLFADGIAAAELIRSIREQNGVPVLPWSPGKWFFRRGKVVAHLLRTFTPQDMLIGDVSLRPWLWPLPLLMRSAKRLGYQIISGSDPLPFPGEEQQFGSYGSRIVSAEANLPINEMLRSLLAGKTEAVSFGSRSGVLEFLQRQRYNAAIRSQEQ